MSPNHDQTERTWRIVSEKTAVEDAMKFADLATSYCHASCREAVVLAVAELAENAIKYGAANPSAGSPTLGIAAQGSAIRVRLRNPVNSRNDAKCVMEMVSRIATAPNVNALYRQRLAELFANPSLPRAQLGLLRIAFEGRFRLSCDYHDPFLELVAERTCDKVK
jgi:hypothetical protein